MNNHSQQALFLFPVAGVVSVIACRPASEVSRQRIHDTVCRVSAVKPVEEPMVFCKEMVLELGLPDVAVNPLIARSFMSHMRIIDRQDL